jgi:hypothetical protein
MTKDEREAAFKIRLQQLQDEFGIGLQPSYAIENYNPSKGMLTIGIVLVEIDGWQPPEPIEDEVD